VKILESVGPVDPSAVHTSHAREMAANLLLGRAMHLLEGACGTVVFWDAEGRWNRDSFALPGRPNMVAELTPVLEALIEWTLYSELPVVVDDLARSRWSRYLLSDKTPPSGSIAATPLAQRGTIWGALAVYRSSPISDGRQLLQQLADLATEPLSSLGTGRPEGIIP
jgi:GAF domain-containing protein